jgi:hypothetical protein
MIEQPTKKHRHAVFLLVFGYSLDSRDRARPSKHQIYTITKLKTKQ